MSNTPAEPLSVQISRMMAALEVAGKDKAADEKFRAKVLGWVKDVPPASRPAELYKVISRVFDMEETLLRRQLDPTAIRSSFDSLVPRTGWLRDYINLTSGIEPPTVFHFFAGAVAIGAVLARNVYFPRGANTIFPNLAVIVVAPSGKCRKTTACNVSMNMLRRIGHRVLADKITPEAFVETFKDSTNTTGVIYAPELAVFLGKQKYQEGMVPMLTALFDCPQVWQSATIMRGEAELRNVAISMLGASTIDWIQTAIPRDAFGGGFMSRLLFVVQEDTPRKFPLPDPLSEVETARLTEELRNFGKLNGKFTFGPASQKWFTEWYMGRSDYGTENRQYAGYFERKPDHLLRVAQVLQVSADAGFEFQADILDRSLAILDWIEQYLPNTFDQMSESSAGADQVGIINQLKRRGGAEAHSTLLRLNHRKMNALQFRNCLNTLRESGMVEYDAKAKKYYLTPEGWNS
jgi:hypothetical protein